MLYFTYNKEELADKRTVLVMIPVPRVVVRAVFQLVWLSTQEVYSGLFVFSHQLAEPSPDAKMTTFEDFKFEMCLLVNDLIMSNQIEANLLDKMMRTLFHHITFSDLTQVIKFKHHGCVGSVDLQFKGSGSASKQQRDRLQTQRTPRIRNAIIQVDQRPLEIVGF